MIQSAMFPLPSMDSHIYLDRKHAGRELARYLMKYNKLHPLILSLPRGGVEVGYEIAKELQSPLDVVVVRKIGIPPNKEFGVGAIGEENVLLLDTEVIQQIGLSEDILQTLIQEEKTEVQRRIALYRENRPLPDLNKRTVILVDDGLATGVTAKAAIEVLKKKQAQKIIFAAPVCANDTCEELKQYIDEVICPVNPYNMTAIGMWYKSFNQVTDETVIELLHKSKQFAFT